MANDTYDLEFTPEQLARIEEAFQALEQAAQDPTLSRYQRRKMALALLPTLHMLEYAQRVLQHRMYKQSLAFMYHVKELGEQGNAKAQAIYEDLAATVPSAEIVPFPKRGKVGE